jgi:hypothetical protein
MLGVRTLEFRPAEQESYRGRREVREEGERGEAEARCYICTVVDHTRGIEGEET